MIEDVFRYWLAAKYGVHWRKPRLLKSLAITSAEVYALKRPLLRYVDFAVDFPCNLQCVHCFNTTLKDKNGQRKLLEVEEYRAIARECRKMGAVAFSFQGGEPLLFLDRLLEVIQVFDPSGALISVTTNGTLGTPVILRRLYDAGVDILTVSLDSGIAEEHDGFRGLEGAFKRTVETIDAALKTGLRVTIGTTVSHQSVRGEGLKGLMEFARSRRCQLMLGFAVSAGRWKGKEEVLLTDEDLTLIEEYMRKNRFVRTDMKGNYLHPGCGAMKEIMYVTPYGEVLCCPFVHISFGDAKRESMSLIRERALKNPYLKRYWPKCLAATDEGFRNAILSQLEEAKTLPIDYRDIDWGGKDKEGASFVGG